MEIGHTGRGFAVMGFSDFNDVTCTLQKSSLATSDAIWLGCEKAGPKHPVL